MEQQKRIYKMHSSLRFILIGAGSIGQRHLRNLQALGHEIVAVADPSLEKLTEIKSHIADGLLTQDENEALEQKADAALICSPTIFHLKQSQAAIRKGLHVFIEKPLSHTLEGTEEIVTEADITKRVVLVGCNLRFFPSLRLVKQLLGEGRIGKPLSVQAKLGYYLPHWRPGTDYRTGYGAKQVAGGGIILDSIHEFDYLRWLLGEVEEVFCYSGKVSTLEIDTEDNADILLRFASGTVANVHLDYLQRTYRRSCEFIGEEGVIVWDYIAQTVTLYGKKDRYINVFLENINTELNQMYIEEMKHFVACIQGREQSVLNASGARAVLEIAVAAKTSAETGTIVKLNQ
ncbi:Gfo/Idh/MocA family protein [Lusitaniella coriacea]|uniref:Gfo/Idh/MocA family protein n=1 Tax=Lusitaniella coriacea TaxID=1983105 RepID=UPI003CECAF43